MLYIYICTYWVMITCDAYFWLIHITSKTTSIFCKIPFKHVCSSLVRRLMNRLIHLRVEVISEESEIAKLFNNYLKIWLDLDWPEIFQEYNSAVENSIQTFENHTCIVKIESSIRRTEKFPFTFLNTDEIKKETVKLDASETSQMLDTN